MIVISDEAEKFGSIQHFCLMEKIWSLDILWWQIHESIEKLTFDRKTMYNHLICNLNSEQLFWACSENPKLNIWAFCFKSQSHNTFLTEKRFTSLCGASYLKIAPRPRTSSNTKNSDIPRIKICY